MTKIKLCGLSRREDIGWANEIRPDYIGFVFAGKSSRYVKEEQAESLKKLLRPDIRVAGVFVDEPPEGIGRLTEKRIIDVIQLHGQEDEYVLHPCLLYSVISYMATSSVSRLAAIRTSVPFWFT